MSASPAAVALPPWDQLDFARNCTAYGQWLSSFVSPNPWRSTDALGGSLLLSIDLFTAALPSNWTATNRAAYYALVLQWYAARLFASYNATADDWSVDPVFVDRVIWVPATRCPAAFCEAIAFTGNADLSGVGVVISYYIEAFLTTTYLVAFTLRRFLRPITRRLRKRPLSGPTVRAIRRVFDAIRGSLEGFLLTAMVLSLAMLVAALVMAARRVYQYREQPVDEQNIPSGSALYDPVLALLVGLYSVFPVAVLYALIPPEPHATPVPHTGSHKRLRRAGLVLLWALAVVVSFLTPRAELDYAYRGASTPDDSSDDNQFADVLYACDQRGGRRYWRALAALQCLVLAAPTLWLLLTAALRWATRRRGPLLPAAWRLAVAWLNLVVMWAVLVRFTLLRNGITATSGNLGSDNQWAFGQVLAIATWVPVVVDFIYLLAFGLVAGGRLPLDYTGPPDTELDLLEPPPHDPEPSSQAPPPSSTEASHEDGYGQHCVDKAVGPPSPASLD